jgi:hypothetical protein
METNDNLNKPKTVRPSSSQVQTSVLVSYHFYDLCKKHGIKFSEAMRVGISVMLAERGITDYNNDLTIVRRMTSLRQQLEEVSQKYYDLLDKVEIKEKKHGGGNPTVYEGEQLN